MHTAAELAASVTRLLSLPDVYWHVKRMVDDPTKTPADLTKVILNDPAMTARILRLVNSAHFGYRGRIESVSRAIALLGMLHVHDLVLASSIAAGFRGIRPSRMDVARFWEGSLHRALSAGNMAHAVGLADSQRPFVEGLLSDIGHLVIYQQVPEQAAQAMEQAGQDIDRLAALERELIGCDAADVGAALTVSWGLPEAFAIAIGCQNRPHEAGEHALEAALLHVAGRLAAHDMAGGAPTASVAIDPSILGMIKLPYGQLAFILQETRQNLGAISQLLTGA